MASFPLSGTVSKCLLVVAPAYAQDQDLLQYIKYKLYDEGFIVVREEFRLFNPELADRLTTGLEATVPSASAMSANAVSIPMPATSDLIGTTYVFVLAHRECHSALGAVVTRLALEDEAYMALIRQVGTRTAVSPLWMNRTPAASKKAVSLLFPQMLSEDIPTSVESREYVQASLKTALLPALTDLAKAKPADPLRWLAERLLETNKQAPPMVSVNPE